MALTEAGERLLLHARPAVDLLSAGLDAASSIGAEPSGRLRLTVPRALLPRLANRLLPEFLDLYPKVKLELFGDNGFVDIVKEGFDAGIRPGSMIQPDMIGVKLTEAMPFAVVGSPAFFKRNGRPSRPVELSDFACIQLRRSTHAMYGWSFTEGGQSFDVDVDGPLIVNDIETTVHAALKGIGLARVPLSLALDHLEAGDLETTLDAYATEMPGLMLYYPNRSQFLPKLRVFADFARSRMKSHFQAADYRRVP